MPYSARWYTLLHAGNPGDVAFYLDACSGVDTVLELGAGIGRISLALTALVGEVTAVEISPEMVAGLEAAARRLPAEMQARLSIHQMDMRHIAFPGRFDRIIVPYNGLLCLLTDDDVVTCLTRAAGHLSPEGRLIFDIYDVPISVLEEEGEPDERDDYEFIVSLDDHSVTAEIYEKSLVNADPRRFDTRYRYDIYDGTGGMVDTFEYDIRQRCIFKEHLGDFLDAAGLELVSITGDFEDAPITDETLQLVVTAKKRGA